MARLFDDGSDEYLEIDSAVISGPPFVLAAWAYSDDVASNQAVICIADKDLANKMHWLQMSGNTAGDPVRMASLLSGGPSYAVTSTGFSANTWHHVMGVVPAADLRWALIDGGSKGTNTTSESPTGLDRTSIGRLGDSTPTEYFSGRIAEAAIWDLSDWPGATGADKAAEFERLAVPALAKGYAPSFFLLGLQAYWPLFRDGDRDIVGGYDLTDYNTPSIATHPPMIYPAPVMAVSTAAAALARVPRYGFVNYQVPGIV